MIGVVSLFLIFIGLFLNIFFPSLSVLDNLLTMLNTFGDNGFVGLIALIFLVGQYFLAYHFYLILSTYRKKLKNEIGTAVTIRNFLFQCRPQASTLCSERSCAQSAWRETL